MVKQCLFWKSVECRNIAGEIVRLRIPQIISRHYGGTLVFRILGMEAKSPISFDEAINLVAEKQKEALAAGRMGRNPGQYSWYSDNFIDWISDLGYHIELTGDEFEPYSGSSTLSQ